MKTFNESRRPDDSVLPLLKWVADQYNINYPTTLYVADRKESGKVTQGWTGRERAGEPILVKLSLSQKCKYPYTTRHTTHTPEVELRSFEEEVVLVAAHELRHASQIATGAFRVMTLDYSEEDAEKHAIRILERYRNR